MAVETLTSLKDCPQKHLHAEQVYGKRLTYTGYTVSRSGSHGGNIPYIDGKPAAKLYKQEKCPGCKLWKIWTLK